MASEQSNRDTRMTALANVTVGGGRRGSRVRRGSLIDETQRDRLITNRNLLLKNVTVTPKLLQLCQERGVITQSQREVVQSAQGDEEQQMTLLLNSMHLQETTVFMRFCDVLTLTGHPLIADYLRDSGLASRTFNFDDLWEQIPSLSKHLHKWEKEKLSSYITSKIKEEVMRFNIGEIQEDREKAVDVRLKQVEQSWKFQKEIRDKDQSLAHLQSRVVELEQALVEKEQEAARSRMNFQRNMEKLSSNVQVATKFNMANDSAIRRLQESLDLYKAFAGHLEGRLKEFDTSTSRKRPEPLFREETSLDGLRKEFDTGRQIDHLKHLVAVALAEIEELREVRRRYEALVEVAQFLRQQMRVSESRLSVDSKEDDHGEALRRSFLNFALRNDEMTSRQRSEIDLLTRFIHGLLPREEVPPQLAGVKVPSEERDALMEQIADLEADLAKVRAELRDRPVVEVRAERSEDSSEINGATDNSASLLSVPTALPSPSSASSDRQARPMQHLGVRSLGGVKSPARSIGSTPSIPFSYHSKRMPREPKPRPDPKPPNAKLLSTRVVNFL